MARQTEGVRDPAALLRSLRAERADHRETRAELRRAEERADAASTRARKADAAAKRASVETAEVRERLAETEARLLRTGVALDKGLPATAVERLTGTTRDEVEQDAQDFAALTPIVQQAA